MSKASILRILSTEDIIARSITKITEEPEQFRVKANFKCLGLNVLGEACAIVTKAEVEAEEQQHCIDQARELALHN